MVIFDVVVLKKTKEGQAVLLDQLCSLLEDDKTTKVSMKSLAEARALLKGVRFTPDHSMMPR